MFKVIILQQWYTSPTGTRGSGARPPVVPALLRHFLGSRDTRPSLDPTLSVPLAAGTRPRLDPRQMRRLGPIGAPLSALPPLSQRRFCLGFRRRFWLALLDVRARAATGLTAGSRRGGRIDGAANSLVISRSERGRSAVSVASASLDRREAPWRPA
jgi:hypothetical protein